MEVVRKVSRTPRGGVRMVKEKVSKVVGFRESIATTSTATSSSKSSSRTRKSIEADGDSKEDKTSPVIKRRRLSERTNMTPKGINKRGRGNIDSTPSRKTPINSDFKTQIQVDFKATTLYLQQAIKWAFVHL